MSSTHIHGGDPTARTTRTLVSNVAAALCGKRRGPHRGVRRHSYDIDDPRARVWRPIADGSKAGGLKWADALLRTAEEYDVVHKPKGARGPLMANGIRVLKTLLYRALDFKTGRLEPTIEWLAQAAGLARPTVVRALARLKAHGFLDWVRRSRKTGADGEFGPQRAQTSNAYFFDFARMNRRVLMRLEALLRAKALKVLSKAAVPRENVGLVCSSELASVLARIERKLFDDYDEPTRVQDRIAIPDQNLR